VTHRPTVAAVLSVLGAALAVAAAPARAQLGIDLSEPAKKPPAVARPPSPQPSPPRSGGEGDKRPPASTPTPTPTTTTTTTTTTVTRDRLAAAAALAKRGKLAEAALAYDAIVRDPSSSDGRADAQLGLAGVLARLGLVRSAIETTGEVLSAGAGPRAEQAAGLLFDLSTRTGDEQAVLAYVPRLQGAVLSGGDADRLSYLLAKYAYERAQALDEAGRKDEARRGFAEARRLAALVKGKGSGTRGDVFARARFVEGLAQYAEGNGPGALESFKEVVRLTNPRRVTAADERLRELALLQLARLHYEHRQNRYAIFYYARMPQGGESWLEGVWESSYAYYRIGDSERALGNLITLQSTYFQDEWFPESYLLKAIIYYENCRYPEARAILEDFERRFSPVHEALARAVAREEEPATFYATALAGGREGDPALARRLRKLALADGNVRRLSTSIGELEREAGPGLAAPGQAFRDSALARDLREKLQGERRRLASEAGARARYQLERERSALRGLLEQALRVKIEVSRREREGLEAQLTRRGGPAVLRDYHYSAAVSDEHLYWPYDGEFWRDELGTYAYTLTKGCRASPGPAEPPGDVRAAR